jgi:hypothetical protein
MNNTHIKSLAVLTGCALAIGLSACTPPTNHGNAQPSQMANNDPYANNRMQPAPYNQPYNPNQPQPSQWPGADTGNLGPDNGRTPNVVPFPNQPDGRLQQPLNAAPPPGMKALPSQAGQVFRASLNGQGPVPQQSRDFYMKLMPYFDAQPQVMGYLDEPSGRMSQVGFQSTKNGVPVMGMLMVTQGQNGGAVATVMLDSPERFQQSMQAMMAAAQQP